MKSALTNIADEGFLHFLHNFTKYHQISTKSFTSPPHAIKLVHMDIKLEIFISSEEGSGSPDENGLGIVTHDEGREAQLLHVGARTNHLS